MAMSDVRIPQWKISHPTTPHQPPQMWGPGTGRTSWWYMVHRTPRHPTSAAEPNPPAISTWSEPKEGASCTGVNASTTKVLMYRISTLPTSTPTRNAGKVGVDLVQTHVC